MAAVSLLANFVLYPIPLPTHWLSAEHHQHLISKPNAKHWIRSESSLTVRIKEIGIAFSLEVLHQTYQPLSPELQQTLNTQDDNALFREVLLKQAGTPLIYAQTIMPQSTVTGTEAMLAELGNQPLGQVLFQSPQAKRGDIEFALVPHTCELATFIEQELQQTIQDDCYIRRSKFHLNNKPLLVCECFLPTLLLED